MRIPAALALLAAPLALAMAACPNADPPRPRNLLLVSLDTMSPAHMALYGHDRDNTPSLDRLAEDGVVFTNAYSTSSWTLPAHASLLSGLYPTSIAPDASDRRLYRAATLLSERFARHGHRTAAVVGGGFVSKQYGTDAGFESFEEKTGVDAALRWIEEHREEPFFFFFHTYTPHTPYRDRRYAQALPAGRLGGIYRGGTKRERKRLHSLVHDGHPVDASEKAFVRALYDGGIARADEMVGRLVDGLERLGLADSTVVVVTSDHGEEFWQHTKRGAAHGHTLHDELLRVPLVWHDPGLTPATARVDAPVSLIDVVPTIVARFGLEPSGDLDGVDLTPLLERGTWNVERTLFAEGTRVGDHHTAAIGSRGKLIELRDRKRPDEVTGRRVYLADDADERDDRAGASPDVERELEREIARHRTGAATTAPTEESRPLGEETRRRLRELGYVE